MTSTLPKLTEREFMAQVIQLAKIRGWRVYHTFLSKWSDQGFPDLTMVRPSDRRLIFAELKRDNAKTTPAQDEWIGMLRTIEHYPTPLDEVLRQKPPVAHPSIQVVVWRPEDWAKIETMLR